MKQIYTEETQPKETSLVLFAKFSFLNPAYMILFLYSMDLLYFDFTLKQLFPNTKKSSVYFSTLLILVVFDCFSLTNI